MTDLNIWSTCLQTSETKQEKTMNDIDYDKWSETLLQEIYYAPDDAHRASVIREHLLKAERRGSDFGWVHEQDKAYKEDIVDTLKGYDKI